MNFYNPYYYSIPTSLAKPGIFSKLLGNGGVSLGGILNGTQKALNFANQAIPLVKQVKPMLGNAKTMFRVMNEFKKVETPTKTQSNPTVEKESNLSESKDTVQNITNGPTFFI